MTRFVQAVAGALAELLDERPGISPARAQAEFLRQEMDREPIDRHEPWRGLEQPHVPLGIPLRPGEVAKRPVFDRKK